jgi:hypothetical protein
MKVEVGWSLLSYGPLSAMTVFRFLALLPSTSINRPQPDAPHSQHLSGPEHYALFDCLDKAEKENRYRLMFLGLAMFTAFTVAPYHVRWDSQETLIHHNGAAHQLKSTEVIQDIALIVSVFVPSELVT